MVHQQPDLVAQVAQDIHGGLAWPGHVALFGFSDFIVQIRP